eukprot:Nitzschia sp. Nitz4//scaffold23_size168460//104765//105535//NITZ4_002229-RA/size168460-processed-gene-0.266-mRNA-1//-1//CDS//3329543665//8209//frame0
MGPIQTLRFGLFLFCCEKEEDKHARIALHELHAIGRRGVDLHLGASKAEKASGFVKSLFGSPKQHTDTKPPVRTIMSIVDATKDTVNEGNPFPQLELKPMPLPEGQSDANKGLGGLMKMNSMGFHVEVPLHRIVSVDKIEPTMLVIVSKDIHSTDEKRPNKEAARISFQSSDDRDAVYLDLKVLVEWNRQRQPDMEEELPADGIRAKAQKTAHFAKRELEMRETKRSREQRKAQYMQGSTGLKYTAMAMATMASES